MIALIQRVTRARVSVDGEVIGEIDAGLLAFVAALSDDTPARADRLAARVARYRVFADAAGRMNRALVDTGGALLVVPQFTLAADTATGNRPGFSGAAPAALATALVARFIDAARADVANVSTGRFGADMQVELVNHGPATFWLES